MTSEQKGAVCGTCGERIRRVGVGINPGTLRGVLACENGHTIPAPVVPSDDRRIVGSLANTIEKPGQGTASIGADGKPECSRHGAMNRVSEERDWWRCLACNIGVECERLPAPPTPSQDAEGDGLAALWADYDRLIEAFGPLAVRDTDNFAHQYFRAQQMEKRAAVESAIREPYEALVKAVELSLLTQREDAGVRHVRTILARIEESLGGRK